MEKFKGMSLETMAKAEKAQTKEELMEVAKESGIEITEKEAREYFEILHPSHAHGELADEELDNVSGGGCGGIGELGVGDVVLLNFGCPQSGPTKLYPGGADCGYISHRVVSVKGNGRYLGECIYGHINEFTQEDIRQKGEPW